MPETTDIRITIRFKPDEYALLEEKAGDKPISRFIRELSLEKAAGQRKSVKSAPVKDHRALAEVLAKLGASRRASNLNQLARAANTGSLPVTPETESALQAACQDIRAIKHMLMKALGIQEH